MGNSMLSSRSMFSLREGATVVALAILIPLAIQGALFAALWTAAQWGSDLDIDGGTTLAAPVAVVVLLLIRYVVLASYWVWFSSSSGRNWKVGLLAALPLVGIIWALKLASPVARGIRTMRSIEWPAKVLVAVVVALAIMALPISMRTATALENRELERQAATCLLEYAPNSSEEFVATVGDDQISPSELSSYVEEVSSYRKGAVAKADPNLPVDVLDTLVWLRLTESLAQTAKVNATVGGVEDQIAEWTELTAPDGGLDVVLANASIPPSLADRYACASLLRTKLTNKYSTDAAEGELSEFDKKSQENAKKMGVKVDSSIGYWNPEELIVQSTPWVESPAAPAAIAEKKVARTFSTRVEYEIASIPNQEFADTLDWTANICIGSDDLLESRYRNQVGLYERVGGRWVRIAGARATTDRGGRCDKGQVNLLIGTTAPEPPVNWTDKGWRTCTDYQVRIPETPNFRPSSVDMCVSAQATSVNEES
jgi:hypothetical protein